MHAEIVVKGVVQGIGFRPFIYRSALENQLVGYVRNRGDAGVEIVVEGSEDGIKKFIVDLKEKKPSLSQIYDVLVNYSQDRNEFVRFSIERSFEGGDLAGSTIPYDLSVCDRCLRELRDPENRRHDYFFTTCTECGPRYTIIERLPYDRQNTTMKDFHMCQECRREYSDPSDRRFHAQTTACKKCGPRAFLTDNDGNPLEFDDPIREAGRLVEEGHIVAVKGNGGFHIAASTTNSSPIERLRNIKHRAQKPFAVMARNLEAAKSFTEVSETEAELLTSCSRPVVLLKKSQNYHLSELISLGLHSVGVMLPYTGLHYMLFDHVSEPAFVMTSGNKPSEPIVTDNGEAIKKLGNTVDFFLFHNRNIAQRCDDSVVRVHGAEKRVIRRSRGYVPSPIHLGSSKKLSALGLGGEENVNSCVLLGDKAFISQYIGDVDNFETFNFLKDATRHLLDITKAKVDVIACDLHPKFITTKLAQELGEQFDCPILQVQHHYAHMLSLMGERGVNEVVGITCDGAGYGSDGNTWGGEVLHCTLHGFSRLGHLQDQPLVGGDLAVMYPLRVAAGMLRGFDGLERWLYSKSSRFPYGKREVDIVLRQLKSGHIPLTSSCGRVLDAIAAVLSICDERTYEGEPAMKLESAAFGGEDVLKLEPKIKGGVIDTSILVWEVFDKRDNFSVRDLAFSAESYISRSLAELAVDEAERVGVETVGFSGGVAYNEHMSMQIKRVVGESGLRFLVHNEVPPGDGGISFGQAVGASSK